MKLFRDIAERAVMTALQAFLAVFVVTDVSSAKAGLVAAAAAALAVIKGALASRVGDQTASLVTVKEG